MPEYQCHSMEKPQLKKIKFQEESEAFLIRQTFNGISVNRTCHLIKGDSI